MTQYFRREATYLQSLFQKLPRKFVIVETHEFAFTGEAFPVRNLFKEILAEV